MGFFDPIKKIGEGIKDWYTDPWPVDFGKDVFDKGGDFLRNPLNWVNPVSGGLNLGLSELRDWYAGGSVDDIQKARLDASLQAALIEAESRRLEGEQNRSLQREFAQKGVGWKIEDAKKYGISPMAAIGASGARYQNVYSGGSPMAAHYRRVADIKGQGIRSKHMDFDSKINTIFRTFSMLSQMQGMSLNNRYMNAKIKNLESGFAGQGDVYRGVNAQGELIEPAQVTQPGSDPTVEAGTISRSKYSYTPFGLKMEASDAMNKRVQGNIFKMISRWMYDDMRLVISGPQASEQPNTRDHPLPPGRVWRWSKGVGPSGMQWRPWNVRKQKFELYNPRWKSRRN